MTPPTLQPRSLWLLGASTLLLVVLLLLPSTGWMVGAQGRMLLLPPGHLQLLMRDLGVKETNFLADGQGAERARQRMLTLHSDDYMLQLAQALDTPIPPGVTGEAYSNARLKPLRSLAARFPQHEVAIRAHALRLATTFLHPHRDSEAESYLSGKYFAEHVIGPLPSKSYFAAYDADAASGERLNPNNAYFPLMRAVGYFSALRDAEGTAALIRAGELARYEEYSSQDADAHWKLFQTTFGKQSAALRSVVYADLLFPHFASIRSVARFAAYQAAKTEAAGNIAEGLAIRHAMMHAASLMRTQSHSSIGTLVGIACFAIMTNRPGGAPPMPEQQFAVLSADQKRDYRRDAYLAYLRRIGQPAEADWVSAEFAAGDKTRDLLQANINRTGIGKPMIRLFNQWSLDMVILSNALEMLILGGAMLLLIHLGRDKGRTPLIVAMGLLVSFVMLAMLAQWSFGFSEFGSILLNMTGTDATQSNATDLLHAFPWLMHALIALASVLVPLLTLLALGAVQLLSSQSKRSVLTSGLIGGGMAVAGALVVLYGMALFATASQETHLNTTLDQIRQNETRYLSESVGKSLP